MARGSSGARRIRTIKPEITDSPTLGRVSREARLVFVLLWTRADDAGRLAGEPRLLASTLFPFDEDVDAARVATWLDELAREGHVIRYQAEGRAWLAIPAWADHQKIDRPTPSRIPAPPIEDSRGLANPREESRGLAQGGDEVREGSRILALDRDRDRDQDPDRDREREPRALTPTLVEAEPLTMAPDGRSMAGTARASRRGLIGSPALAYGLAHGDCLLGGFCGWMCLPVELVEECANRIAGLSSADGDPASVARRDEARAAVVARFSAVMAEWKAERRAPTGRKWDFWRQRFTEWQGDTSTAPRGFDPLAGITAALAAPGRAQ